MESPDAWEYIDEDKIAAEEALKPEYVKPDTGPEVINETDKWLIFTTGNRTKIPHQVGIKRLSNVRFKQHMDLSKGCLLYTSPSPRDS